jgi:hypothetical protein
METPVPSINDPLPNGAPRNPAGRGGPVAALAREGVADALARCRAILDSGSPLTAGPAIDAAALLMRGTDKTARRQAVTRLRDLVRDPKTPDATAVRAAAELLRSTGRRAYKGN